MAAGVTAGMAVIGGVSNYMNAQAQNKQAAQAMALQKQAAQLNYKATLDATNMMMAANNAAAGAAIGAATASYNVGQKTSSASANTAARDAKRVGAANVRDVKLKGLVQGGKVAASSDGITAGRSKAREQIVTQIGVTKAVSQEKQKTVGQISKIAGGHTKFTNQSNLATKEKITNIAAQTAVANSQLKAQQVMAYGELAGIMAQKAPQMSQGNMLLSALGGALSGASSGMSLSTSFTGAFGNGAPSGGGGGTVISGVGGKKKR